MPASKVVPTTYSSVPITIADDFLSGPPKNATGPTTVRKILFENTDLPEYQGCYAVVMDGVLSASECAQLLAYARESVIGVDKDKEGIESQSTTSTAEDGPVLEAWKPAMVNAGPGLEVLNTKYRNSDRIIWDHTELVERLWKRICMEEMVREDLRGVSTIRSRRVKGKVEEKKIVWKVTKLNERMRFLRYGKGQFFRPHCDGPYSVPGKDERTFYTFHFYLNDSVQELRRSQTGKALADTIRATSGDLTAKGICEGGATTFHSRDYSRRLDIDPKMGRVLIFQHDKLLHSGDDVVDGLKYTMRTDLQFERVSESLDSSAGLWE